MALHHDMFFSFDFVVLFLPSHNILKIPAFYPSLLLLGLLLLSIYYLQISVCYSFLRLLGVLKKGSGANGFN